MIGLYAENSNTSAQLVALLQHLGVGVYDSNKNFSFVVWLSNRPCPTNIPHITMVDLDLPMSLSQWQQLIQKNQEPAITYQNNDFLFDATLRVITDLKTKQQIPLTEKENALLAFLTQAPNHQASRAKILEAVWQYSPQAETHTLESHLYALKQKLGAKADKLLSFQDNICSLI